MLHCCPGDGLLAGQITSSGKLQYVVSWLYRESCFCEGTQRERARKVSALLFSWSLCCIYLFHLGQQAEDSSRVLRGVCVNLTCTNSFQMLDTHSILCRRKNRRAYKKLSYRTIPLKQMKGKLLDRHSSRSFGYFTVLSAG